MTTAAWLFSAARLSAVYPCLSRRSIFWPSDSAFATLAASPSAAALKKATAFGSIAAASSSEMAERRGLSEARSELRDVATPDVVEAAVQTWMIEDARLAGVRRAVGLVEEALRGRRFIARL